MNKKYIIIGVVVIILLGFGGYLLMSKGNGSSVSKSVVTEEKALPTTAAIAESPKSLKSILAAGIAQKCTFVINKDNYVGSGTVYISGGKVRGDITAKVAEVTNISHMLMDGNTTYIWMGDQTTGFKMTIDPKVSPKPEAESNNQGIDPNQEANYKCTPWIVDSSLLTIPTNVTFSDFSSMLAPKAGKEASSGASDKCAACSYLTGGEKTQCLTALGCSN